MIEIKNLTFEYFLPGGGQIRALEDINLEVGEGERVAVIGPSGAGKSTLLKCINHLHQPSGGSVKVNGEEISALSNHRIREIRQKLGMIFQNFNLIQRISAIENVLLGRLSYIPFYRKFCYSFAYSRRDFEIALDSLRQVQIEELAYRRVDRLSGGQQQRVGVARALAQEPTVILADEPVSNLDPKTKREIMELVTSICEQKDLTLLISMHEVNLVKEYVNRVLGLVNGKIVFDDTPKGLTGDKYAKIYG